MNPLKIKKVSDKSHVHSVTAENQSTLPFTDNELILNTTNIDEEKVSGNLKIKKLNHDCLAQVLMHLSVLDRLEMEKVCKKWEEAAQMSSYNFKKLNFNDLKITLDKKEETWRIILEKYGRYLTDLTISYDFPWICNVIKEQCHNLIHFDIDRACQGVSCETILRLITSLSKLKYLKVKISTKDSPNFFTQLMSQLPNDINEIHLIPIDFYVSSEINAVPDKFKSIRCLTLEGFRLNKSIMDLLLRNANTLDYLDLSCCHSLSDLSIFSILHNLEYLDLSCIKNLNANVITTIARNCPKLNHFEWYSLNVDQYGLQLVPYRYFSELKYLSNLEHLCIEQVERSNDEENFLSEIANNCKKLKHLDTGFSPFSTTDIKEIIKLKNLEYLNLGSTTIDSESLIKIAHNCLELKKLFISSENVDESAIDKLKNLKKLENLKFFDCNNLTGNVLIKIVNSCKYLKDVKINNCKNVTEASLIQVGKLEFLESLNINYNIFNVPIAMFDYFHNLKELFCRDCLSVTDKGIIKVIDNCQNLSKLYLTRTSVTVKTLIHASKRKFIFQVLRIRISKSVEIGHHKNAIESPYLKIVSE